MINKPTKIRSKKITQSSKGKSCKLRTPNCNGRRETVVFCHAPSPHKATATKSDDFWGADGCSGCHEFVESNRSEAWEYWPTGIFLTQKRLFNEGLIKAS